MSGRDLDALFAALGDPMRRQVVERLADVGAATPTELAVTLPISRQAVSKHLSSLDRAGLVERERRGREARYHLCAAPLTEVLAWCARVGSDWDRRLAALAALAEE